MQLEPVDTHDLVADDRSLLALDAARPLGLIPLTMAEPPDCSLRVGNGARPMTDLEWLMKEQARMRPSGDRQAELIEEGEGWVSGWVDQAASWEG